MVIRLRVAETYTGIMAVGMRDMEKTPIGMAKQDAEERAQFERELGRIIEASKAKGLILRVLGSLAFQLHCPKMGYLQQEMGRAYTDIDFAGYGRQAEEVRRFMPEIGYAEKKEIFILTEGDRAIFERSDPEMHVDVFFDKLSFSHVIQWDSRLEVDAPTIPLAELFLEKMQIVKINEKDVIDTIMLLLEHPLGASDEETTNVSRVAKLCASDWGLWRTVTMNLGKVQRLAPAYDQLTESQKAEIAAKTATALERIEAEPKSLAWRIRARVGDRVKWYTDVDEVE